MDSQRRLIWIPVIHAPADLGSLGETARLRYVQAYGESAWGEHERCVARFWVRVKECVDGLGLVFSRVRLYQDGLPVCGHEEAIVGDLARAGSPNHALLLELTGRGAQLMGTEDPGLLAREYQAARDAVDGAEAQSETLKPRDQFVCARIAATLQPGETGLVFLGLLHSLKGLPEDIQVTCLSEPLSTAFRTGEPPGPPREDPV